MQKIKRIIFDILECVSIIFITIFSTLVIYFFISMFNLPFYLSEVLSIFLSLMLVAFFIYKNRQDLKNVEEKNIKTNIYKGIDDDGL